MSSSNEAAERGPSEKDRISHYEENSMTPRQGTLQAAGLIKNKICGIQRLYDYNADPARFTPIYIQFLK